MQALELTENMYEEEVLEIDGDDFPAINIFQRLGTQWIYAGMDGVPVGLNYQSMFSLMEVHGLKADEHTIDAVQIMESQALSVMAYWRSINQG